MERVLLVKNEKKKIMENMEMYQYYLCYFV